MLPATKRCGCAYEESSFPRFDDEANLPMSDTLKRFRCTFVSIVLATCATGPHAAAADGQTDVRQTWQLLDYIAVDYSAAVDVGKVIDAGVWSEQAAGAIVAGAVAGGAVLAGVAFWMLRLSRRLPITQFFRVSALLIAVLAVVLVGKGTAALQEAGWVAQTPLAAPRIEWLGMYPWWQSILAQVAVAIVAVFGFLLSSRTSMRSAKEQRT